jgi:hypothetical protein
MEMVYLWTMTTLATTPERLRAFAERLRELPFVRDVRYDANADEVGSDGLFTITDRKRRHLPFLLHVKSSYLDRASTNVVIVGARLAQKGQRTPTLLLARYIPQPTADRLMEAGINFVDLAGNMHIDLGDYSRTVLGRLEPRKAHERRPITAAQLQVLFVFATEPDAVSLPVREIAVQAGVSKSKAAQARQQLIANGLVSKRNKDYHFHLSKSAEALLVSGYTEVLRPKLTIGRFRAPERRTEDFLERVPTSLKGVDVRFALTGGPAADLLHPYYRGAEIPLFVTASGPEVRLALRILPDRNGSIVLLRAFGELVFWKEVSGLTVAPPWLVYAELMQASDARAHEAAEELRQKCLPQ